MTPGRDIDWAAAGNMVGPVLLLVFLGWMMWALWRRGAKRDAFAPNEPGGTPYHVYTREFDRVVAAREVPKLLVEADGRTAPTDRLNVKTWPARRAAVERIAGTAVSAFAEGEAVLQPVLARPPGDLAVMLLIDQSGSMHDNILSVAASVRWLSAQFDEHGVPLAVAGFASLGWRGGAVRKLWASKGKPQYPGRLCALLHIRYRDFDGPLAEDDFRAMVHPHVLRENVDGEAIEWAVGHLAARPERDKVLVVLSDGAPVDDSTLMENGRNFLVRHIRRVIADTEAGGVVRLGAVGIEHRVNEYYAHSTDATDLARLPLALAEQIADLASEPQTETP